MSDSLPQAEGVQTCPSCGTLLDVAEQEPLARVHCPMCGTAVVVERQFNQFVIKEILGQGGMGTVYRAEDTRLNREIALKLLRKEYSSDPEFASKLDHEAKITASINHPHVVKVFSFGQDHGQLYLAMELVSKGSLDDLMNLSNKIAEIQAMEVGLQIAQGLDAALKRGLIHRDVKPGNILFADAHTAKIVDFGLAILAEKEAESRGEIWGTPYYVAPEKLNQEAEDFRSDIYSLGGTLFHAIAGRPPFEAETASLVALKHLKSQAVSLQAFAPDVSGETAFVINRMLHKNPDERYQSYDELMEHMQFAHERLLERGVKVRPAQPNLKVENERSAQVVGWLTLVTMIVALGIAAAGVLWVKSQGDPEEEAVPDQVYTMADARPALNVPEDFANRYAESLALLSTGKVASAFSGFEALANRTDVPQPTLNWTRYLAGLAALMDYRRAKATPFFAGVRESAVFSRDPRDRKLAEFFSLSGRLFSTNYEVDDGDVSDFESPNGEGLGLFAAGLHNWNLGEFKSAIDYFNQYVALEPVEGVEWTADFKPFAREWLERWKKVEALASKDTSKLDVPAQKSLIASIYEMREQLPKSDPLQQRLLTLEKAVASTITKLQANEFHEERSRDAEERRQQIVKKESEDLAQLLEALQSGAPSLDYSEANMALTRFKPATEEGKQLAKTTGERLELLNEFREDLIQTVNAKTYPRPMVTKGGVTFRQGITRANETRFEFVTPYGATPVEFEDLPPLVFFAMAVYYAEAEEDAAKKAHWFLLSANYASAYGLGSQATAAAAKAIEISPELKPKVEILTGGKPLFVP